MAAKLVAEEGVLKELVLLFDQGSEWIIGRDSEACQLLIEDPSASRKHALCRQTAEGIVIESLSVTNPIWVNDEELTAPRLLQQGDRVKIGDTVFAYYADDIAYLMEEPINTPSEPVIDQEEKELDQPINTLFGDEEAAGKEALANVNFDLVDTGRWLLKVVSGPNSGAEFPMQAGGSYLVGTDPNTCDIVFYDTSVSRQHLRITVSDADVLTIEDLKSRNGTRVDGEMLEGSKLLPPNTYVSAGTTSFVIYDREGAMQTLISPLLPSIVKALKKEEGIAGPLSDEEKEAVERDAIKAPAAVSQSSGAFIILWILIGLFAVAAVGISTLFIHEQAVVEPDVDTEKALEEAFAPFPSVKYSFNKVTGRLLLVGHVLTASDRNRLNYSLQGMKFIKDIDDGGVIINEYVWREINQVLADNPNWRGVTVYANTPGHFILSGYLETRKQADEVWEYMSRNFPYLDLLENKIVVEEDVLTIINKALRSKGFTAVAAKMGNTGELILSGNIAAGKEAVYNELLAQFKDVAGVRDIQSFVSEASQGEAVVNITGQYTVSGFSRLNGGQLSVVINGRILTEGDMLDDMTITKIQQNAVFLLKDGVMYRIDFGR
jgi:type III secretion system YscD/HrpQ family protein